MTNAIRAISEKDIVFQFNAFVRSFFYHHLSRKQRKKMQSHLHQNQNQCVEQPNRMLANGPNHPGPGPEEIPMVDVSPHSRNTQQVEFNSLTPKMKSF